MVSYTLLLRWHYITIQARLATWLSPVFRTWGRRLLRNDLAASSCVLDPIAQTMISRFNNTAGHTSNRPHSMQLDWDSCVKIGRKLSEKGSLHNLVLSPSHRPVFDWKPSKFGWREGLGTRLFMFHAWCSGVFMLKLMQPKTLKPLYIT